MEYYTYAYLREDGTPYYIGKGKKDRIDSPLHSVNLPIPERRIFLKKDLSPEEAVKHEIYLISVLGRKDLNTGILRNRTDGGEGTHGRKVSEETRDKLRKCKEGFRHTEEAKQKIREARANQIFGEESNLKRSEALKGRKSPMKGRKHSEETKRKMREAKLNKNR